MNLSVGETESILSFEHIHETDHAFEQVSERCIKPQIADVVFATLLSSIASAVVMSDRHIGSDAN